MAGKYKADPGSEACSDCEPILHFAVRNEGITRDSEGDWEGGKKEGGREGGRKEGREGGREGGREEGCARESVGEHTRTRVRARARVRERQGAKGLVGRGKERERGEIFLNIRPIIT